MAETKRFYQPVAMNEGLEVFGGITGPNGIVWLNAPWVDVTAPPYLAVGNGVADDTDAMQDAITAAINVGLPLYVPPGIYRVTAHIGLSSSVTILGGGMFSTVLSRGFSGASDADGLFNITGGADVQFEDMTILSALGTTGGCLISAIADSGSAPTPILRNVNLTTAGTNTHAYGLYFDGSLKSTGAVGIRSASLQNVQAFGGASGAAFFKSTVALHWLGGGCYQAGGTSGALAVTGTAGVPSSYTVIDVNSLATLTLDRAEGFNIKAGLCGAVTNTANTANGLLLAGNLTSVESNWVACSLLAGDQKLILGSGKIVLNPTALNQAGLIDGTSVGNVFVGIRQDAATAKINFMGAHGAGFAVPDTDIFTFTMAPTGLMFSIAQSGGKAGLFFATYNSATITIVSDPASFFENSATPTAGKMGVFKSAGSFVVSVINSVGAPVTISVLCFGGVSANTDPA